MAGLEDRFEAPARFADAGDRLHELVTAETGLDDFGPDDYLEGLEVLLLSLDYDPHFSERGRRIIWGECYQALAARARAFDAMKRTPGFDRNPIQKPVVITGIPRTGTTALHKLLAVDDRFQGLQGWLITAPTPRPPRESWDTIPAFLNAVERLQARMTAKPEMRVMHDMAADEVDECVGVLRQGFVSNVWCCAWSGASYDAWWQTRSELHCYQYYYRVLQLIGSSEPEKRWLLKNPGHIDNLDLLFATFPDAMVINTHRDPGKAVPSLCSLLYKNHALFEQGRDELRARLLGIRETEKWANAVREAEPVRTAHRHQVLDVMHADFHRDPMGTVSRIYDFIGFDLTPEVAAAMERRVDAKPEQGHGTHRYDARDFGLTAAGIRARFGDYIDRFQL